MAQEKGAELTGERSRMRINQRGGVLVAFCSEPKCEWYEIRLPENRELLEENARVHTEAHQMGTDSNA